MKRNSNSIFCKQKIKSAACNPALMRFFFLIFFMLSFAFVIHSYGQVKSVMGVVTDTVGAPLQGVSVAVKGAKNATATDANGNFTITVLSDKSVLVFSYVGFERRELTVGERTFFDVEMKQVAGTTQDVVVVGYGTQRKATLTGSVTTVGAKTFADRGPIASPLAALQGQAPGVMITRSSAQPGRENWNFQVRGATSVNGTEPLVIVDGLPLPNLAALNSFNPNDIENISFLKDAAAAIYGARAAGGVVLVTTKRAKSGKATIEYSGSVSRKTIGLQPKLVDINGWGPMTLEARESDGFASTDGFINLAKAAIYAKQNNIDIMTSAQYRAAGFAGFTDVRDFPFFNGTMQDILWGPATSTEHQVSVAGRAEKSGYRLSLGYLNDGSLLQYGRNTNRRYNIRLAHDYQITSRLKLETNISLEKNDIIQPTGIGSILNNGIQPGQPAFAQNGKAYVWGSGIQNASTAAIAELGGENKEYNTRVNTNFNITYNIAKGLRAVGSAGYYLHNADYRTAENLIPFYDYSGTQLIATLGPFGGNRSAYQRGTRQEAYYNLNGYFEYSTKVKDDHDVRIMAGSQYERNEFNRYLARTLDAVPNAPNSLNLSTGDPTSKTVSEAANHYALGGYFSRLNYTYQNKYLFEASGRYDGSSRFRAEDRWKFFYGFSAGWRILQENFMKNVTFFNDLKLRASYGTVGNQSGIGLYDYLQFMNINFSNGPTASGFPIIGGSPVVRVAPGGLVAYDRTWEKVSTKNIGLDFALLRNRLSGTFDYFIKRNDNMLIARTFPAVLGAGAPAGNNGVLESKGWEAMLNWRDKIGSVTYHIGGNVSDSKNKLVSFGNQTIFSSANQGFNSAVEGYPINSYFGLEYAGRIQTQKDIDDYKKLATGSNVIPQGTARNNGLQLGDNMFKDLNGDGKITFPEDAKFLGTDDPRYSFGLNAGAEWNGFDFNVIFQGVGKRNLARLGNWRIPSAVIFQAQNEAFLNKWWTPNRIDAYYPRISSTGTINNYNYFPSDWVIEDASYIRLKNLVIGYSLPRKLVERAKIQRLRIYFSGNDLWESQNIRDGWDPEAPRTVENSGDANNGNIQTFSQRFPFYRYYTFGVNVTF